MEHAEVLASDQTWAAFATAVPSVEPSMAAQLLGDYWAPHEQEHEWIEAMAAMLLPSLDGDSSPSSAWPQLVHSTTSTDTYDGNAFFAPSLIYESLEQADGIIHSNAQSLSIAHQTSISSVTVSTKRNLDMVDGECKKSGTNKMRSSAAAKAARRSKKAEKRVDSLGSDEDYNDNNADTQSSSSCTTSGEENSELGNAKASSGRTATKAGGRAITDAQCLYARKRRERINERLRILQNLVPNGTKVDISTMLEEAVQYVKFLQLQIKLLSSDDLWMFAPIAYNGVNISNVDLNISLPKNK